MKNVEEIKKTLLYVRQKCAATKRCDKCPFWDDVLECRLNGPMGWWIDDWKVKKNEAD